MLSLYNRAIALSASPNLTMDAVTAQEQNRNITVQAGCGGHHLWQDRLSCMRNANASVLLKAMPKSWMMPTEWDLPKDIHGKQYPGILVVDGSIVAYPFFEALERAVIDVPLLLGGMAEEGDANIPVSPDVSMMSREEWLNFLNGKFEPWGEKAGEIMYDTYEGELKEGGPRKAYDAIVTDMSMTCGYIKSAQSIISGGCYTSPVWLYNNAWRPSQPVWIDGIRSEYAFHNWDVLNGFAAYSELIPATTDVEHGAFLREAWYGIIADGE